MDLIGNVVIYVIMACAVAGAIASIKDPETGLGREFKEGLHSIGPIFIPVAGIMASIPYLSEFIRTAVGPLFATIGADPSIAATTLIAVDMGGYQLAEALARSREAWAIASIIGFMSGATVIFSIPVGLAMLARPDHKYMALGIMAGILSVPVGVFVSCVLIWLIGVDIRPDVSTTGDASYHLALTLTGILSNLLPLILFCAAIALGLHLAPDKMITGFLWFGRILYACITLVLVASIVEYFTGIFSAVFGSWGFDPIIADKKDQFRALEIAGYIGIMLAGAFPMVYLLTRYLSNPMTTLGERVGLSAEGAAGLLAAVANILAMYRLVGKMTPKDKVLVIAFAVCAAFTFGDHLAFSANFQPTLILPLVVGKLSGGCVGFLLAKAMSVPKAEQLSTLEECKGT